MNIRDILIRKLAIIFPYILFIVSGAGFIYALTMRGKEYAFKSLIYVIPVLLAGIILLILRNRKANRISIQIKDKSINYVHIFLVTILLLIVSVIILFSSPTRPWAYFVVVSLTSGLIFAQIIYERPLWTDYLIIFQIILLSLDLIWGVTLKYPLYFGDTDILIHLSYVQTILQTGRTSSIGLDYLYFPLFHILNAMGVEITDLSIKNGLFIFFGISWQVGILFAYLIFKKLSNSRIFSLSACLLLATSQQIIFYGMYAITRSLAYVMVLCWIYLILGKPKFKYVLLSFITISALILIHHATVLFFLPIIIIIYVFQILFTRDKLGKSGIQLLPILFLTICFFAYIFYIAYSFTNPTANEWFKIIITPDHNIVTSSISNTTWLISIYFSFVLLISLIGIGTAFKNDKFGGTDGNIIGIAFASVIFLLFYISGPLNLIPSVESGLIYRFQLLVAPFIIYIIAYGFNHLISFEQDVRSYVLKRRTQIPLFTLALIVIMIFFSTISISNGDDNSYILRTSNIGSEYFSNSELASFSFVEDNCNSNSNLYGDYQTARNKLFFNDFPNTYEIKGGDISYIADGYLVFRSGELQKTGGLKFSLSGYPEDVNYQYNLENSNTQSNIVDNLSGQTCIYSDNDVQIYIINRISQSK